MLVAHFQEKLWVGALSPSTSLESTASHGERAARERRSEEADSARREIRAITITSSRQAARPRFRRGVADAALLQVVLIGDSGVGKSYASPLKFHLPPTDSRFLCSNRNSLPSPRSTVYSTICASSLEIHPKRVQPRI